jgi:hypothetical protein
MMLSMNDYLSFWQWQRFSRKAAILLLLWSSVSIFGTQQADNLGEFKSEVIS